MYITQVVRAKILDIFYLRFVKIAYVKQILQKKTTILNYF